MEKVCGGGDDMVEGMQCSDHPYRNNPGGICAFCLQEKLGKLVSSSKSTSFFSIPLPPQSSSSSPSFRSDGNGNGNGGIGTSSSSSSMTMISLSVPQTSSSSSNNINCGRHHHYPSRNKIPFLLAQKKSKKVMASSDSNLVLKRSKSSTAPGARRHFIDDGYGIMPKKGFWSFFHISTKSSRRDRGKDNIQTVTAATKEKEKEKVGESYAEENESPNSSYASSSSFGRKVARSRSVGCGSRSFSGDFLEKISTGFGDCTLRRVESQREAKPKTGLHPSGSGVADHRIKERVKCGGIFAGFSMISSSVEDMNGSGGRTVAGAPHGRNKSWGWAFASPIRAFSRSSNKTDVIQQPTTNTTPNLDAIPSLLAVRG